MYSHLTYFHVAIRCLLIKWKRPSHEQYDKIDKIS